MKRFCKQIKPQWRITIPNGYGFRKSSKEPEPASPKNIGFYDLQEAQDEFNRSRSLPSSVYIDCDSSDSEEFEDADMEKDQDKDPNEELEAELYADVLESNNLNLANGQFEYDVPKISFKFFEPRNSTYENAEVKRNSNIEGEAETEAEPTFEPSDYDQVKPVAISLVKTEAKIVLEQKEDSPEIYLSKSEIKLRPKNELALTVFKCGSDPNLNLNQPDLYKEPRSLQANRLSRSLHEFNPEEFKPVILKGDISIEHISCSQTISQPSKEEASSAQNSETMDYCKTRSKLPLCLRRPTFLIKPKKAVDGWNNFRSRFNKILEEQASTQRVGAFSDSEKVINFEGIYRSGKVKCRKVFETTGKVFKRTGGSVREGMVKNEAFFDKVQRPENSPDGEEKDNFSTIKSAFRKSKIVVEGQNGFEDMRRYVKQGGDFCKELSAILQERAEAETQYAKSLSKLSAKLVRACRDGVGTLNEAWKGVALELEARAEGHRLMGNALMEETARPLRTLTESQHRVRKQSEAGVDKAAKLLSDWRAAEAKGKKNSHTCARDNEKLQDAAALDSSRYGKMTLSRSTSLIQMAHMHNKTTPDKENAKLEGKKKKAEDAVKKADIEYYTLCVRAERARLEWESAVLRGVNTFQALEEERLNHLKGILASYLQHSAELGPKLIEACERLKHPVSEAEPSKDLSAFHNLRQTSQQVSEQLLPDFYCEHITLAMNKERRKQALVKLLHLIRQDIERERKSKNGLEKLSSAIKQTPNFGTEDSQQTVTEKLYHMKSMLTYLEGARYKVQNALAELECHPRSGHPLADHITITRDKSGLQQSVLKVPQWLRDEFLEPERSPISEKSNKSAQSDNSDPHINDVDDTDWPDRGAADGNSNQPDSDFDEFSSQCSSNGEPSCNAEDHPVTPIAKCKALYPYSPNLNDELQLRPGDVLSVYRQQDDGWWLGECNGSVGIFPATYVEVIPS